MLLSRVFLQSLRSQTVVTIQQLHTSVNLYNSSSSSSSDSDSDSNDKNPKETAIKEKPPTKKIEDKIPPYLSKQSKNKTNQPKEDNDKKSSDKMEFHSRDQYSKNIADAVRDAAKGIKNGDKEQIESTLLNKVTEINKHKGIQYSENIWQLITTMKVEQTVSEQASNLTRNSKQRDSSVKVTERKKMRHEDSVFNGSPFGIFPKMPKSASNIPKTLTWDALEQHELEQLVTHPPRNALQEMIMWTKQGKLWKFPIDNEQGMDEEHKVHFTEHIFMERHLKGWCPTRGPVRHFMELVCVGLSKNPYLTVQEKVEHIMWFKDFFKQHEGLLHEIGAIDTAQSQKQIDT